MDNEKIKILMLVEGERQDIKLMDHLLKVYGIQQRHEIVSYNTNIYVLYNRMFRDTNPEDIDILQILKEHEKDSERKKIFDEHYSDVLLIFDLDPQDPQFSSEKVLRMLNYFVESSDMGKLYLNYPMVEAFYHMKSIPDKDYEAYTASMAELQAHQYKSRVTAENRNHDYGKFAVDKTECDIVINQNIDKAWMVSEAEKVVEGVRLLLPDSVLVLEKQLAKLKSENALSVLCTCAFYIPDYNPKLLD